MADVEGQYGICVFPDGESCEEWSFYSGECGREHSYCATHGLGLTTKRDGRDPFSPEYAVCIGAGGAEVGSVAELSGLERLLGNPGFAAPGPEPPRGRALAPSRDAPGAASSIPSSFSWRSYQGANWMTAVRDQGVCGSCWAFASAAVAEAAWDIGQSNPNLNLDLSEEFLVSPCYVADGQDCCGGFADQALAYIETSGIPDERCMPYVEGASCSCSDGRCPDCTYESSASCSDAACWDRCTDWNSRLVRLTRSGSVAPADMKDMVSAVGPLMVTIGIGSDVGGGFDANGVYRCANDSTINHAVVIAGYNDAGGYWLAKNSWGAGWNGNGYFKIGYGECAVENDPYFAVYNGPSLPEVQISPALVQAIEGDGPIQLQVRLSRAAVNWTIRVGYAYDGSPAGTVSFAPGETDKTLEFANEWVCAGSSDSSFVVTLIDPIHARLGASTRATVEIADDGYLATDAYEPDNDPSQAKPIEFNATQVHTISTCSFPIPSVPNDKDHVRFELPAEWAIAVDAPVEPASGPCPINVTWSVAVGLMDSYGSPVAYGGECGVNSLMPGVYTIAVSAGVGDHLVPRYRLTLRPVKLCNAPFHLFTPYVVHDPN